MTVNLLTIWALSYLAHLAAYFGLGLLLIAINRRHPERRLQKDLRGEARARVEIRQSVISLVVTSFCTAFGIFAQVNGLTLWPAATPSMFGYSARRSGVNQSAMRCVTVAEQFTVETIPM